ncbi:MAG: signal peptidase I [Alphaproteobacteria bacterium]|nr:signal peptidase I [Alphaproteobacteria bacterium]
MLQAQNQKTQETKWYRRFSKSYPLSMGYCIGIGAFMAMGWWLTTYTQLLESASESLEGIHYILVHKSDSIKRGDIVSVQGHTPQYIEEKSFTKRIIGLPGDQITKHRDGLELKAKNSSISTIFPILAKTKEGQVLTPLCSQIIPEGYAFVAGDHPRSFDSRYEEFGLVSMTKVWGKGIFTW